MRRAGASRFALNVARSILKCWRILSLCPLDQTKSHEYLLIFLASIHHPSSKKVSRVPAYEDRRKYTREDCAKQFRISKYSTKWHCFPVHRRMRARLSAVIADTCFDRQKIEGQLETCSVFGSYCFGESLPFLPLLLLLFFYFRQLPSEEVRTKLTSTEETEVLLSWASKLAEVEELWCGVVLLFKSSLYWNETTFRSIQIFLHCA